MVSLLVGVILITVIEGVQLLRGGDLIEHAIEWLIAVLAIIALILVAFREARRLNQQLNQQLTETRSQAQRQATLLQLSARLASSHDEQQICQMLLEELRAALKFASFEVFLIDRATSSRTRFTNTDLVDLSDTAPVQVGPRGTRMEIPLRAGQERVGGLVVEPGRSLSEAEHSLLVSAANLAVLSILNARLFQEQLRQRMDAEEREVQLLDRGRALRLFNEITSVSLEALDYPSLLQALADNLGKAFEADGALIMMLDESTGMLRGEAAFGPQRPNARSLQYEPGEMVLGKWVLDTGQAVAIQDARASSLVNRRVATDLSSHSMLAFPLIADNQKLGIALLTHQKEHAFSSQEVHAGEQAARQMALAIAKVRALAAAQNRAHELDALQKATAALLTTLDLEKLLGHILDTAISAIPTANRGTLHLLARETGQLQVRAIQGYTDARIRTFSRAGADSYTARSVRERQPLLVQDAPAEQIFGRGATPQEVREVVSAIIAPLQLGEESLGAISLESYRPYAFTQADLNLLVSFAATATTAIQNAQLHAEVQKQAITDTLTGLYNRRGFSELGRREVERALRFNRPLTALMLDIDYFKDVNDEYGHLVGDNVLIGLATRFLQELRQIDLLGRYGGDEFVALLPETDLTSAVIVAERLRKVVAGTTFAGGALPVKISLSVGVAALSPGCKDLTNLLQKADEALYEAKGEGRDRVVSL